MPTKQRTRKSIRAAQVFWHMPNPQAVNIRIPLFDAKKTQPIPESLQAQLRALSAEGNAS